MEKSLTRHFTWLWLLLLVGATLFALIPATPYAQIPKTDSSVFLYTGRQILAGQLPYRDIFDHKPPMIYFINALGLAVGGSSSWGVWAMQVLFVLAAAISGFYFLCQYYPAWIAGAASAAFLANLVFVLERGNLTEEYSLPFQFAGLALFAGLDRQKGFRWRSYLFGATFGMTLMSKQTMIGLWVALGFIYILQSLSARQWRALLDIVRWAAGSIIVILPWILYFWAHGILGDFWQDTMVYNFIYSATTGNADRLAALEYELQFLFNTSEFFTIASLAWFAGFIYVVINHRPTRRVATSQWVGIPLGLVSIYLFYKGIASLGFPPNFAIALSPWRIQQVGESILIGALAAIYLLKIPERRWYFWLDRFKSEQTLPLLPLFIALLDAPIELLMINIAANNFAHYFMAILPCFTILIASFLAMLTAWADSSRIRIMPLAWAVLFLFPIFVQGVNTVISQSGPGTDEQLTQTVAFVEKNTQPQDYVLTWGFNAQVNFLADRRFPTKYIFQLPLFQKGYSSPELFNALLAELKARPPVLIIDTRAEKIPLVDWDANGACTYPQGIIPDGFSQVADFVCQNYELAANLGKNQWLILKMKN